MGFLGGGFFGSGAEENTGNSTSETSTINNQQDFADASGVNSVVSPLDISTGNIGKNAEVEFNITNTDYGAIDSAIDAVSDGAYNAINANALVTENALLYGAGSQTAAYDAIAQAQASVDAANENALIYGAGSQMAGYEFANDVITNAGSNQSDVFEYAAGVQQEQNSATLNYLDFADGETDDVLTFTGGLVGALLDSAGTTENYNYEINNRILDSIDAQRQSVDDLLDDGFTYSAGLTTAILDASQQVNESLIDGQEKAISNLSSAFSNVQDAANSTLSFISSSANSVMEGLANFSLESQTQLSAQNSAGLQAISDASASADEETREDLLKLAAGFGVLFVVGMGYMVWSNKK